ncbi:MAG: TIGR04211 family SH3 domain-containing protein [Deltaproteobacteria bacterium]|nr:TIGR04211 family SH3 domain-containing protein [Deltaproteobacteria bacterium]
MSHKILFPFLIIALLLNLLLLNGSVGAEEAGETRYISDKIKIYARAGAGTEFKLLTPLSTGHKVTLLGENQDDWVHIGYGKKRQGWIQKRFLTTVEPAAKRLLKANARIKQLEQSIKTKIVSLTATNKEYRKGNTALLREVKGLRSKLQKVEKEYKTLRKGSANFLKLQAEHKSLLSENQGRQEREAAILTECELLKTAYRIKWFLAGGGILMVGFFIGLLLQAFRHRNKKSSGLSFK